MDYKYHLKKYSGISSRHTCPNCGAKHSFVLYVDDNNEPLHETVGRCNHESSCGYNYTPAQYFHDHPDFSQFKPRYKPHSISRNTLRKKPLCTIPDKYVAASLKFTKPSDLTKWLLTFIDPLIVEGLTDLYRLGVTSACDVIYFQIDTKGRCRSGKIMKYDPQTGHRIKDDSTPGKVTWIHSILKSRKLLPSSWELTQCLFGEHLLTEYPDHKVILVESEKTALIGCAFMPQYTWLATGGKSNINSEKLSVLKNREIIAYPDRDAIGLWKEKLAVFPNIRVSDLMERYAEADGLPENADLADWIISHQCRTDSAVPNDSSEPCESREPWQRILENENVRLLIEELDLELVSVSEIREADK